MRTIRGLNEANPLLFLKQTYSKFLIVIFMIRYMGLMWFARMY